MKKKDMNKFLDKQMNLIFWIAFAFGLITLIFLLIDVMTCLLF